MTPKTVALIGTFDTKGEEFSFLRERIESAGLRTLMIDVGVLGSPPFEADISQAEVAAAANENLAALKQRETEVEVSPPWRSGRRRFLCGSLNKGPSTEWLHWAVLRVRQLRPRPCVRSRMAFQN